MVVVEPVVATGIVSVYVSTDQCSVRSLSVTSVIVANESSAMWFVSSGDSPSIVSNCGQASSWATSFKMGSFEAKSVPQISGNSIMVTMGAVC